MINPFRIRPSHYRKIIYYAALALAAIIAWSIWSQRWPGTAAFNAPTIYGGDGYISLGVWKGFSEFPAPWDIQVARLNAPFGAPWNDYPLPDKLTFYVGGALVRWFDAGAGLNIYLLCAHVSAALAFAWTARRLGANAFAAGTTALLFAFSPFMFGRSIGGHLNLIFIWHIPLMIWLLSASDSLTARIPGRYWIGGAVLAAATAWQNPYYAILLFLLFGFGALRCLLRGNRSAALYLSFVVAVGGACFVADQLNVLLYAYRHGPNPAAAYRDLPSLITWGLRLPDLFWPIDHPLHIWKDFGKIHYFDSGALINENQIAFLGISGLLCTFALITVSTARAMRSRWEEVPFEIWIFGFTVLFAVAGGFNYLLGSFGFVWLRATNRYSILLLCLALLWAARASARFNRSTNILLFSVLLALSAWEGQMFRPDWMLQAWHESDARAQSDRQFVHDLEAAMPHRAAVFEFPVMDFPESAPISEMVDYEPFRPYIWSKYLRFSYGAQKGRSRDAWQHWIAEKSFPEQIAYLSAHGFSALILNRRGYPDHGAGFEAAARSVGARIISVSQIGDFVAFSIPKTGEQLPSVVTNLALGQGWWNWEQAGVERWIWSRGNASLTVAADPTRRQPVELQFQIEGLRPQTVDIMIAGNVVRQVHLEKQAIMVRLQFIPEAIDTEVLLKSDTSPMLPGNGDPRVLGFRLIQPSIRDLTHNP